MNTTTKETLNPLAKITAYNPYTTVFFNDPSHGWYEVHREVLKLMGILDKITHCSYQKGDMVYLEEDCDATLYFNTAIAQGWEPDVIEDKYQEVSIVRRFSSFRN